MRQYLYQQPTTKGSNMKDSEISKTIWTVSTMAALAMTGWTLSVTEPSAGPFGVTVAVLVGMFMLCSSVTLLGFTAVAVAVVAERIDRAKRKPQPKHARGRK